MGKREKAAQLTKTAYAAIKPSIPLTFYGFSIWALPYLLSKGIGQELIQSFGEVARVMLVDSFDDKTVDFTRKMDRLAAIFRESELAGKILREGGGHPVP